MEGRRLSCGLFQFHITALASGRGEEKKKAVAWYHNVTFKFYAEKALSRAYSESFFSQFFFLEMWWCEDRQNWGKKQSKTHLPHSIIMNHPVIEGKWHIPSMLQRRKMMWQSHEVKLNRSDLCSQFNICIFFLLIKKVACDCFYSTWYRM